MSPALSAEEMARRGGSTGGSGGSVPTGTISSNVKPPSSRYKTYNEGNVFKISVPENWREAASNSSVRFAPDGAYGQVNGQAVFTHGMEVGLTRNETHSLREATQELVSALTQSNRDLRQESDYQQGSLDGRNALSITLSNVSEVGRRPEVINIVTTLMRDGNLFYGIAVSPKEEYATYQPAFRKVVKSIQIND